MLYAVTVFVRVGHRMPRLSLIVPFALTALAATASFLVCRPGSAASAFGWLAVAQGTAFVLAIAYLHREEALEELVLVRGGDISRGIAGAAFALVVLYAIVRLAIALNPAFAVRELVKFVGMR